MAVKRIPFSETDKRVIEISCIARTGLGTKKVYTDLTQLDLLQILSYLKLNVRLHDKIVRFIQGIDEVEGRKTDFKRKLPRRGIVQRPLP